MRISEINNTYINLKEEVVGVSFVSAKSSLPKQNIIEKGTIDGCSLKATSLAALILPIRSLILRDDSTFF